VLNRLKSALITAGQRLPRKARSSLFHFAYNCAPDEFEKFAYLYFNVCHYALREMSLRGFAPRSVVDVGAYRGEWSRMVKAIWPPCHIIMVEPNIEQREHLRSIAPRLNATFYPDLLGAEDGKEVNFNIMDSGSSIFPEQSDVPRKTEARRLRTLDSVVGVHEPVDLLKIDAQGYELQILAGGERTLQHVQAVILEVSLIEVNQGCPLLHEVISYMYDRGFVAYDLLELHRRPLDRALFQVDLFFCRESSQLRGDKRLWQR
jgi:FkbM family methyltransferase